MKGINCLFSKVLKCKFYFLVCTGIDEEVSDRLGILRTLKGDNYV